MAADLVGISLALGPNDACYIPLAHGGSDMFAEKPEQVDRAEALAKLKPLLESDAVLKILHNAKYDINVLARSGVLVAPIDDTMIISFDLDAGRGEQGIGGGHGMDELADRHLGHTCSILQGSVRDGQESDPLRRSPAGQGNRICRRRRGCDAAALSSSQAAPRRSKAERRSMSASTVRLSR